MIMITIPHYTNIQTLPKSRKLKNFRKKAWTSLTVAVVAVRSMKNIARCRSDQFWYNCHRNNNLNPWKNGNGPFSVNKLEINLNNWRTHPYNRVAFSNIEKILPISIIKKGNNSVRFKNKFEDLKTLTFLNKYKEHQSLFSNRIKSTF